MKKDKYQEMLKSGDHNNLIHKPIKTSRLFCIDNLVSLALIILLGIIIYSNSFNCTFHFDDTKSIVENKMIRDLSNLKVWLDINQGRLVAYFSFAINYQFDQLNVWGYHFVNLLIHLINACLVWVFTISIFSSPLMKDQEITRHKKLIAIITALLFVSHPLATQSVTYIVQRMASLAALFYLLSLVFYIKGRLTDKSKIYKCLLFSASFLAALLAVFTKENAFTLPFAIILVELFFIQNQKLAIHFKDYRIIFFIAALMIIVFIVIFKFSLSIFNPLPPTQGNAITITPSNYLFTQFSVIVKYIQLLFLPINQNLDHDFPISNHFLEPKTIFNFLILVGLIILGSYFYKGRRIISFGIFWFFLTLSIESSIIPINDVIFEHRTYLPSLGYFIILCTVIIMLLWDKKKFLAISLFVVIIGSNSFLTFKRNLVWKDNLTLWSDVISKSPNKARPYFNRGLAYHDLNQLDKAISDYDKTIKIKPDYTNAYCNRGIAYWKLGQREKSITDYNKAIEINPNYSIAYSNRADAYSNLGQWNNAIADYSKLIELEPDHVAAYNKRGSVYGNTGLFDKAIADFSKAIELDPKSVEAYINLGSTYGNLGNWNSAVIHFTKAIGLDPKNVKAYINRGIAYSKLGKWGMSIEDYNMAIRIDPNNKFAFSQRDIAYKNLESSKTQ